MQPYQEAAREIKRQGEQPLKTIGTAASIGGGLAASRVLPFLSQYIPSDLFKRGLNKIDPRFGNFINKAESEGTPLDEIKNFIKEKVVGSEEQDVAKENRNVIEQYSPELHQFLSDEVSKGRVPLEAASLAQNDKRFTSIIDKLSKDHKTPWSNIVESVYGKNQPTNQEGSKYQSVRSLVDPSLNPQPTNQEGTGQQALMAILQKIQQLRGN